MNGSERNRSKLDVQGEGHETRRCGGRERREFGAVDSVVERVAFDRGRGRQRG